MFTSETKLDTQARPFKRAATFALAVLVSACGGDATSPTVQDDNLPVEDPFCSIPEELIFSGGLPRDGIPALRNPLFVAPDHAEAGYLRDFDRVIGIEIGGEFLAVPHNILWWHEIVNLDDYGTPLAVSYCPLTGSSMVFDRTAVDGTDFGVSGLLYNNNLMMFNRLSDGNQESFFPQMLRGGRCGPFDGEDLPMYPSTEMRWDAWKTLHPETGVVSGVQGYGRNYQSYPYGDYELLDNGSTLFPNEEIDRRRPPKERVLGIPRDPGSQDTAFGMAFPFGVLASMGDKAVVHDDVQGSRAVVVFWSTEAESAVAFLPLVNGGPLTFEVRDGGFFDVETGSEWDLQGRAISGPLEGSALELDSDAFVAFWFGWSTFYRNTGIFFNDP